MTKYVRSFELVILYGLCVFLLNGCQKKTQDESTIVQVEGESVTQDDLDFTVLKLLGPERAFQIDEVTRKKILKSIVISKVIAKKAEGLLNDAENQRLNRQIADFREQQLIKHYLKKKTRPEPVTREMVTEYYNKNLDRFGGVTIREFEMVSSSNRLLAGERGKYLKTFNLLSKEKDWKRYIGNLKKSDLNIDYRQGAANEKLLHVSLKNVIRSTKVNDTSKVFFIEGKIYVVRVINEKTKAARPLYEVGAEIRKMLAPIQLQKAISMVSDEVLKTAKVEYVNKLYK